MSENLNNSIKIFQKHPELIKDSWTEYKCSLCKKLMIDPSYLKCACEFCYLCILEYLNYHTKCPNESDDCSSTITADDIEKSNLINKKISKLTVNCINKTCNFENCLSRIDHHIDTCDKTGIKCLLYEYGCSGEVVSSNELEKHMKNEQQNHINYLIEIVKNLQTEINSIQKQVQNGNNTSEFREAIQNHKECIEKMQSLKNCENEKINNLEAKFNSEKDRLTTDEKKLKKFKAKVKLDENNMNNEINEIKKLNLKEDFANYKNQHEQDLNKRLAELENKWNGKIADLEAKFNEMELNQADQIKDIPLVNFCPFQWVIDDWPTKVGNRARVNKLLSDVFYSNRGEYKMRIGIIFKSSLNFTFCAQILKGDHDDQLSWPCRFKIQIEVMKNDGEGSCKSVNIEINQDQPKTAEHPIIFDNVPVSIEDIKSNGVGNTMILVVHKV